MAKWTAIFVFFTCTWGTLAQTDPQCPKNGMNVSLDEAYNQAHNIFLGNLVPYGNCTGDVGSCSRRQVNFQVLCVLKQTQNLTAWNWSSIVTIGENRSLSFCDKTYFGYEDNSTLVVFVTARTNNMSMEYLDWHEINNTRAYFRYGQSVMTEFSLTCDARRPYNSTVDSCAPGKQCCSSRCIKTILTAPPEAIFGANATITMTMMTNTTSSTPLSTTRTTQTMSSTMSTSTPSSTSVRTPTTTTMTSTHSVSTEATTTPTTTITTTKATTSKPLPPIPPNPDGNQGEVGENADKVRVHFDITGDPFIGTHCCKNLKAESIDAWATDLKEIEIKAYGLNPKRDVGVELTIGAWTDVKLSDKNVAVVMYAMATDSMNNTKYQVAWLAVDHDTYYAGATGYVRLDLNSSVVIKQYNPILPSSKEGADAYIGVYKHTPLSSPDSVNLSLYEQPTTCNSQKKLFYPTCDFDWPKFESDFGLEEIGQVTVEVMPDDWLAWTAIKQYKIKARNACPLVNPGLEPYKDTVLCPKTNAAPGVITVASSCLVFILAVLGVYV